MSEGGRKEGRSDTVPFPSVPGPGDTPTLEGKWVVDVPNGILLVRQGGLPPEANVVRLLLVPERVETEVPGRGRHA